LIIILIAVIPQAGWAAKKYSVIYRFTNTPVSNSFPRSGLTLDATGNLYGVAIGDCLNCSSGEVFELSPASGGGWTESILHIFNGADGASPTGGLVLDSAGNVYGTTAFGGLDGSGTVFELQKGAGGKWTIQTLHDFDGNVDGAIPYGSLLFDGKGNLFGTTSSGGPNLAEGSAFELSPAGGGLWTESWLHVFTGGSSDGSSPWSGLVFDQAGNLYGTTISGGQYGGGTVFKLAPNGSGGWNESIIFNFDFATQTGSEPETQLVVDAAGNLYGTTYNGDSSPGNVFELSPSSSGVWNETVLYQFPFPANCTAIFCSVGPTGLTFDSKGNLWGTTAYSGTGCNSPGCGTVYFLSPQSGGTWKYTLNHTFGSVEDGSQPLGPLVLDPAGNMSGTASYGANRKGNGNIFRIMK
jgi:uncharacterized repeat protein (TIGR03803 family)